MSCLYLLNLLLMIRSHTNNENYMSYLVMEIFIVAIITFISTAIIIFYTGLRSDVRRDTTNLESLLNNPFFFMAVCLIPAIIAIIALLYFRNRNYIVGYLFDDDKKTLTIEYRSLRKKLKRISIEYQNLTIKKFQEKKILVNQTYKGSRIVTSNNQLKLDFITNNFIWEKQTRDKVNFVDELKRLEINSDASTNG